MNEDKYGHCNALLEEMEVISRGNLWICVLACRKKRTCKWQISLHLSQKRVVYDGTEQWH